MKIITKYKKLQTVLGGVNFFIAITLVTYISYKEYREHGLSQSHVITSVYEIFSKPRSYFEESKKFHVLGYYDKNDLPRLFVSKKDSEHNNFAASVLIESRWDLTNCEKSYVYVTGDIVADKSTGQLHVSIKNIYQPADIVDEPRRIILQDWYKYHLSCGGERLELKHDLGD